MVCVSRAGVTVAAFEVHIIRPANTVPSVANHRILGADSLTPIGIPITCVTVRIFQDDGKSSHVCEESMCQCQLS